MSTSPVDILLHKALSTSSFGRFYKQTIGFTYTVLLAYFVSYEIQWRTNWNSDLILHFSTIVNCIHMNISTQLFCKCAHIQENLIYRVEIYGRARIQK